MYQSFPQRHYSRSNSAMPIVKEAPKKEECTVIPEKCEKPCEADKNTCNPLGTLFGSLELDDLIIIGIILVLLMEGTNDILLLAILGIILFF